MTYGPWIKHDGHGCPLTVGQLVELRFDCGCQIQSDIRPLDLAPSNDDWHVNRRECECLMCGGISPKGSQSIKEYRVKKPRGLEVLEEQLRALPEAERA